MKGIILAGGTGSRLRPITWGASKQLLPIYDKPMIYYPLSVLMLAGIRDILVISTPQDIISFQTLLGNGSNLGISISYEVQKKADGIASAFLIGEKFIDKDNVCLVLGDNIFYGQNFSSKLAKAVSRVDTQNYATIFGYQVNDPSRFGVVEFDHSRKVISLEEKPSEPKSNYAVSGLYFYDNTVVDVAKTLKPSERAELEITDINKYYLNNKKLYVEVLGRGFAWLDTGTHDSLLQASNFVKTIQDRQGFMVACLEEISLSNGWINPSDLRKAATRMPNTGYAEYLLNLVAQK